MPTAYGRVNITFDTNTLSSGHISHFDSVLYYFMTFAAADEMFSGGPTVNLTVAGLRGDSVMHCAFQLILDRLRLMQHRFDLHEVEHAEA